MGVIQLEENIEVMVDNCGVLTFIKEGEMCFVYLHPKDTAKLTKFLVQAGYSFCKKA